MMTRSAARVTLTFDNGPDPSVTPQVLDVLGQRGIKARFFIVGNALRRDGARDIVAAAAAEGHPIGNHSMTHSVPLGRMGDAAAEVAEIDECAAALGPLGSRVFRPFGGGGVIGTHLLSRAAVDHLVAGGWTVALWTSVPRDWEDPVGWPAHADLSDSSVVVLHDLPTGAMEQLPAFLDRALDAGVEFTTELPAACTPIIDGVVCGPLDGLVT